LTLSGLRQVSTPERGVKPSRARPLAGARAGCGVAKGATLRLGGLGLADALFDAFLAALAAAVQFLLALMLL